MRLVAAPLLALALLAPRRAAQEELRIHDTKTLARLAAELAALAQGADPASVGQRLSALGSAPAALLFDALGWDEMPAGEGTLVLGEREHRALLEGARRLDRAAFLPLWSAAAAGSHARGRRTVVELVGLCGKDCDLDSAVQAASPDEACAEPDPDTNATLERAVAELLAREPGALQALRPVLLGATPEIASRLIRAAGHAAEPRTLGFLADLLGFDARLDLPLLSEIADTARRRAPPFEERLRVRVRSFLAAPDPQVVRVATMALAELEDEDALPALLDLCASPDRNLSAAAFLALERTTGLTLPRRTERWRSWYQTELAWMKSEGPSVTAALGSRNVRLTVAALRSVAAHRLERQRLAAQVVPLLAQAEALVRLEACRTLGALAAPGTREALEGMLADPDPRVAAAAQDALRAMGNGP